MPNLTLATNEGARRVLRLRRLRHRVGKRRALHEFAVVLREARVLRVPIDLAGLAEVEPAEAAADRDVGERIAVVVTPGLAFQVLRHDGEAAMDTRELLVAPGLAALLLRPK